MWSLITSLLARFAAFKVLLKALGGLAWLIPLAFILKAVGLPILLLIAVLGAPIFIVLALIGLPLLFVFAIGGLLLAFLFALLAMGFAALKIALPVLIVVWIVRWMLRRHGDADAVSDTGTPATDTP